MSTRNFKRILLKITGESMLGKRNFGIDPNAAKNVAKEIKSIYVKMQILSREN